MSRPTKRPEPPHPLACCQGGCVPCVFDAYERELQRWEHRQLDNAQRRGTPNGRSPLDVLRERLG